MFSNYYYFSCIKQ